MIAFHQAFSHRSVNIFSKTFVFSSLLRLFIKHLRFLAETLRSLTKHLHSIAKLLLFFLQNICVLLQQLRSLTKHFRSLKRSIVFFFANCVLLQNYCICSQNICATNNGVIIAHAPFNWMWTIEQSFSNQYPGCSLIVVPVCVLNEILAYCLLHANIFIFQW